MYSHTRKPFTCPCCGAILAQTDGTRLYIGAAWIERTVTLHCEGERCRLREIMRVWRPLVMSEVDEAASACYT